MFNRKILVSAMSLILIAGCSDNGDGVVVSGEGTENGQNNGETDTSQLRTLQQLETNDAFFDALRDGLIRQQADSVGRDYYGGDDLVFALPDLVDADVTDAPTAPQASAEESIATDSAAGSDGASSNAADVTTTNVQEIGVDEQDRMKSDGEYLYVLDNQQQDYFFGPEIDFAVEPISVDIDVAGDEAIEPYPYPQPTITNKVRILQLQNDAPDALALNDIEFNLAGGTADGMYLHKSDGRSNLIFTGTSYNSASSSNSNSVDVASSSWYNPYAYNNAVSVVGKMDVTDPMSASLDTSIKIDGHIVSSRRIDDNLFIATRFYPSVGIDPYSMSAEEYATAIESSDLTEALPKITSEDGSQTTELVNPGECFVSRRATEDTDRWYTPDIITLSVIDLNSMELKDSECFLGSTETLYATPNSVYLATTQWDYYNVPVFSTDDVVGITNYTDPRVNTDIHQFAIDGSELTYSGSGAVAGHLGWNNNRMPFRMSEKGDHLRVATFSGTQNFNVSPINVSVLNVAGNGPLTTAGVIPNDNRPQHIGKPGEQLYASRYLGDKGYLVTFRQTDPLYVVDFTDPNDPKLAGELEIQGFSDYLQPIGEDYLLGIGRDATSEGFELGVKLSLFNVSDASNPTEVQSIVVGERGTYSEALSNHRAITIQAANDQHPTRVAFGISVNGQVEPAANADPFFWPQWNYTGLHGFDVRTGTDAGIERRGVMVSSSAANNGDQYSYYGSQDRSVIVGDSTYYVFGSSVYAADWNDLGNTSGPR